MTKKLKELIGKMKDKASQGKAAILSKRTVLSLLRATSHDSYNPPTRNHLTTLISSSDGSRATASAAVELLMDRLQTTQNSAVALKCLIAVHYIIKHGTFILRDQISVFPNTGGRNYLNLSNFRDGSSSIAWELSSLVRWYAGHVEQLLCTSRTLGFFLGDDSSVRETREERVSAITNGDLLRETESLLTVLEGIGKRPSVELTENNKLVVEIVKLVEEDAVAAVTEVAVRVKEFRERVSWFSFGEMVELGYVLKRLEARGEVARERRLWDWVRELKEKLEMNGEEEEGKLYRTVTRKRETESDRFGVRVLRSVDLVRFPSSKFL